MTEQEKMHSGDLYLPDDPDIVREQTACLDKLYDFTHIYVGDYTMLAPNVILATAGHPMLGALRERNYQYNMPVRIGRNCWLGAGVIVLPGVTIGDNTVVGAGSVVTKDLPSNVLAVGTPARVLREIGDHDRAFYFKDRQIDPALLEGI